MANTKGTKKTTSTKTTGTKTTAAKKRTVDSIIETEETEEVNAPKEDVKVEVKEPRKYEPDDLIPCKSVTPGELIYHSQRSNIDYVWRDKDDEIEMLFSDLRTLYVSRSKFIYKPWFIILDDELLEQWANVRDLYKQIYKYEDLEKVLEYPVDDFRNALLAMPEGLKSSLKTLVATKVDDGSFDSLQKIKVVDQILGTDLQCLIE